MRHAICRRRCGKFGNPSGFQMSSDMLRTAYLLQFFTSYAQNAVISYPIHGKRTIGTLKMVSPDEKMTILLHYATALYIAFQNNVPLGLRLCYFLPDIQKQLRFRVPIRRMMGRQPWWTRTLSAASFV
jgi:hypothetical protein